MLSTNKNIEKYAEELNFLVKEDIYDDLEHLIHLMNSYSKEIHTGFEKVYEQIFQ